MSNTLTALALHVLLFKAHSFSLAYARLISQVCPSTSLQSIFNGKERLVKTSAGLDHHRCARLDPIGDNGR
jgi:hypothetical protein